MARALLTTLAAEEATYPVAVSFRDLNGTEVTPDAITWSLCAPDGTIINSRDAVSVESPAADIDIVLTGDDLAKRTTLRHEPRVLHVDATYDSDLGEDLPYHGEFLFYIEDLVAVS